MRGYDRSNVLTYHTLVEDYDPTWSKRFEKEAAILRKIYIDDAIDIIHIDSTSVPGMAGKPQIDILVLLDDIKMADRYTEAIEKSKLHG